MTFTRIRSFSSSLPGLFVALLLLSCTAAAQQSPPASAPAGQGKVFVFFQRTDAHGKYSKSDVFHDAMDNTLAYLKEKNVAMAVDEFGGRSFSESAMPLDTVFKIAQDANAASVLYIVVDRPVSKWIKVTADCMDMHQKSLWKEEASNGSSMSGGDALRSTEKKLREKLEPHVGKDGLPVATAAAPSAAAK